MAEAAAASTLPRRRSKAVRRFWRNPRTLFGVIVLALIVLAAVFAPLVATHDPIVQNLRNRLSPPIADLCLGTDQFVRETYIWIHYVVRVSQRVGIMSIGLPLSIST